MSCTWVKTNVPFLLLTVSHGNGASAKVEVLLTTTSHDTELDVALTVGCEVLIFKTGAL